MSQAKETAPSKSTPKQYKHTHSYLQILGNGTDIGDTSPSVLLFFDSYRYVFNVGEGFQRYCFQHRLKLGKLCDIFLTRMSTEAAGGLPGLAITMMDQIKGVGTETSDILFHVHGPLKLDHFTNAMRHFMNQQILNLGMSNFGSVESAGQLGPALVLNQQVEIRPILILPENNRDHSTFLVTNEQNKEMSIPVACYVCQLADVKGKFLQEKAKSLGVKIGPDCGKLVAGCCVEGANGQIVRPEQVMGPTSPGPTTFIIDCPDESYISPLIHSTGFDEYCKTRYETVGAMVLVHLAPYEVVSSERYLAWMKRFPKDADHIIVNQKISNSSAIMRKAAIIQTKLNLVDKKYFPMPNIVTADYKDAALLLEKCIAGKDLLKYHLKPCSRKGLDNSQLMEPFDATSVAKEFQQEEPEVMKIIERFNRLRSQQENNQKWKIKENELEITFLGTGAAIPSKYRNVTGIYLDFFNNGSMMLDCGEGSYGQLIRKFGKDKADEALKKLK